MKKLYMLMLLAVPTFLQASDDDKFARQDVRTQDERDAHFSRKQSQSNFKEETPEFRFALKLLEYTKDLANDKISSERFLKTMQNKIDVYMSKLAASDIIAGKKFIHNYMNLPLIELKDRVGTTDQMGTMARYKGQNDFMHGAGI